MFTIIIVMYKNKHNRFNYRVTSNGGNGLINFAYTNLVLIELYKSHIDYNMSSIVYFYFYIYFYMNM